MPLVAVHRVCSIRGVEGVNAVEVERDVLGGVGLDGRLHARHRPLRATRGVERELDGFKDLGVVALVQVVAVLVRQLEEELPHGQGAQALPITAGEEEGELRVKQD